MLLLDTLIEISDLSPFFAFIFFLAYTWVPIVDGVDYPEAADINTLQTEKLDRDGEIPATGTIQWDKGANVASADPLVPGADGNFFHITGTTNFAAINAAQSQPGTVHCYVFDGILTMTHHATDLILPSGANIITAAGDRAIFIEESADKWRCVSYTKADGSAITGTGLQNLINNGSFEDSALPIANTPSGWTLEGTPTCAPDTGVGFGVPKAIKITGTGAANEGLKQTLSGLKANTLYTIIWLSKATAGDTARLLTTGGSANADTEVTATSWTVSVDAFTTDATPANVILKVVAKADGDIVWFDNIMVVEGSVASPFSPHPNDQHLKAIDYQDATPTNYDYGLLRMECGYAKLEHEAATSIKKAITFGTAFNKLLTCGFTPTVTDVSGFVWQNDVDIYLIKDETVNSFTPFAIDKGGGFLAGDFGYVFWWAIGV